MRARAQGPGCSAPLIFGIGAWSIYLYGFNITLPSLLCITLFTSKVGKIVRNFCQCSSSKNLWLLLYVQWGPQVSVQRRKRRKSWFLGPVLVLKCDFFVKGGRRPLVPHWMQTPQTPSFHPDVLLDQKSALTPFKHHNFLNTAAMQILLTSLKNLKSQQLNLFTPLWMKINVYCSTGHLVYCTVL